MILASLIIENCLPWTSRTSKNCLLQNLDQPFTIDFHRLLLLSTPLLVVSEGKHNGNQTQFSINVAEFVRCIIPVQCKVVLSGPVDNN